MKNRYVVCIDNLAGNFWIIVIEREDRDDEPNFNGFFPDFIILKKRGYPKLVIVSKKKHYLLPHNIHLEQGEVLYKQRTYNNRKL